MNMLTNKDYKLLMDRIRTTKNRELFSEPCPLYEPEWMDVTDSPEDWHDFWYGDDE